MSDRAKLRIGLVGCGWHGGALAQAITRTPALALVACADPDAAAASRAAAIVPDVSTHASVEALLAESEVDAVVIATPHHLLAPVALAAMRFGKHVLAEKPIALNEREAAELAAEAARSGVTYMAGYSFRFSMGRYLHDLVASGAVGAIRSITGAIGMGPLNDGWIAYPETGGGPLLYVGCHLIDLALWLLGDDPVEVFAQVQRRADTGADETTTLLVRFANGALAQFLVTQAASTFFYELGVHGSAGMIALRGRNFLQFEVEVSSTVLPAYTEPAVIRPGVRRDNIAMMLVPELEAFATAVSAQHQPAITVAAGQQVLRILDAVTESGRLGRPIGLR
jgi:phthalate 4,5-cis-dihydrodiol dehydrogenase